MNCNKKLSLPTSLAENLARRAAFEELVGKASRRFVGIRADQFDPKLVQTLGEIGDFVGVDRSYVFLYDREAGTMSNTHEWCSADIETQQSILQNLPIDVFGFAAEFLEHNPILDIPLVADLPPEATAEKEILEEQDILSVILVALRGREGKTIGFIGFDAVREVRPWQEEDAHLLELVGGILVAAIEHRRVMTRLTESEARNRATLEAVPDLVFILNDKGSILDFRAPVSSRLALSSDKVRGSSVWSIIGKEYHGPLALAMIEAGQQGKSGEFEYMIKINGQDCYFEGRLTMQKDGEFLALIRDITERRESEVALKRLALEVSSAEECQRRELALQLHDGIGQELTGLLFRLQSLGQGDDSPGIEEAVKILQRTMRRTQDLTFDLSPPILYELGLDKALQALMARFDSQEKANFIFIVEKAPRKLDDSRGILLYRIARELLLNTIKHADPSLVELHLDQDHDGISLWVTDDGKGMDPATRKSIGQQTRGGFGLFSIKQRIEPLGGTLHLEVRNGTTVRVTLPLCMKDDQSLLEATS